MKLKIGFNHALPIITILVVLVSVILMVSSMSKLSQTHDESGHIVAGLEWFQGSYEVSPQNPPFSRIWSAVIPYLRGERVKIPQDLHENYWKNGAAGGALAKQFDSSEEYRSFLPYARLGILIFLLLTLYLVYLVGNNLNGKLTGYIAVILLATTPLVVAHSTLATTDVPAMGTCLLSIYLIILWIEKPDLQRSVLMGIGFALAVCTKFTAILFVTPSLLVFLALKVWKNSKDLFPYFKTLPLILFCSLLTVWTVYRFSFGLIGEIPHDGILDAGNCYASNPILSQMLSWKVPAPEFFKGLGDTWCQNQVPLKGYLMGDLKPTGSIFFYPVSFIVKTPLTLLLLFFLSIIITIYYRVFTWKVLGIYSVIVIIFLLSFISNLNIGLRHIIQVFPFIALVSAFGVTILIDKVDKSKIYYACVGTALLLSTQVIISWSQYPHWLSYFNLFGGNEPGNIIVDSDLDWGQGMYELEDFFEGKDVDSLHVAIFHTYNLCNYDLPDMSYIGPTEKKTGWIAISEFVYRKIPDWGLEKPCDFVDFIGYDVPFEERYDWLRKYEPVAKVGGGSIRIYHISE
ncbi:glycosyltransferase family 39 protein [Mangrovivirga sp. M17]|uniref:Glycosyltransferase family 39 protein n=1 Tax=Mangrovivirga halotolerans TaxID=2993936 RepID=A0ABT3RT33_9BACT|nr:glycosyltransferase family 39 protein [Mangrovivirga halotolerans]MCX2744651.1 glycosyltransferase family 39 protein [Mangrovivirga halotolerans]